MRIALVGQGPFGASVLERLIQDGETLVGVFSPVGRQGDPVQETANKLAVPVYRTSSMKDPQVYQKYTGLGPDLGVMAFVTDIVPVRILGCPSLGTIQYHPSLLPKHRGGSAINWAIIEGETKTGITIFWPDEGIDTGPILLQKEVDILPDDTVGSLYFNKLFALGIQALSEAVDMVRRGVAPRIPQDHSQATHEGLCTEANARIDWSQPTRKTYDLIRGTNPQPGATTYLGGRKLKIFDCVPCVARERARPGQILDISALGLTTATIDGAILIKRVQVESAPKEDAASYAKSIGLKIGMVFGE